ncbi:hypothetical protein SBRCBS47491_001152 [Sporothrix bragantina]|uniref:Uncharacterized protein n=1 Tax=Sporothrix bragantina TaxID=671064 RepID=A0ABP0AWA2_9PEZI
MGAQQPFLYEAQRSSASFPEKTFDPKAVTRASWEPKPVKPKQEGPLVQLNRHPDAHEVIGGQRKPFKTMSSTTKAWIKAIRVVQLLARFLQFVGATGILVLVILITGVPSLTTWVLRITAGFVIVHTAYAIYHLSKPAGYRTPASSGAYQVFAAFSDLCILPLYAYGAMAAHNNSQDWTTLLTNKDLVPYLITAFYYTILGSGSLHGFTLVVSFWLAVKFRQIAQMPPDMNPLEDRYTSRAKKRQEKDLKEMQKQKQQHSRNKSSIATADTFESLYSLDNDKGLLSRPPSVPFLHTRTGSQTSIQSRDPRLTLPSQNSPASPARSSLASLKRSSVISTPTSGRGAYAEVPLNDGGYANSPSSRLSYHSGRPSSRPNSGTPSANSPAGLGINDSANGGRPGKFTETWNTTDSMVNRTQQRNQALNTMVLNASGKRKNYEVVSQAFDFRESDDDASDTETVHRHPGAIHDDENSRYDDYDYDHDDNANHSNAHNSNPLQRTKTPFHRPGQSRDNNTMKKRPTSVAPSMTSSVYSNSTYNGNGNVLGEVPINDRRVSGGYTIDITEAGSNGTPSKNNGRGLTKGNLSPQSSQQQSGGNVSRTPTKRWTWAPKNRQSSVQNEDDFYSKPYGQLKSATPPIMVGKELSGSPSGTRQVSSGNDYDLGSDRYLYYGDNNGGASNTFGRRNVSGKIAEEGRAYSRYSTLNN